MRHQKFLGEFIFINGGVGKKVKYCKRVKGLFNIWGKRFLIFQII